MALIDLDKFVASFITEMKECSQMRNFSIPRCIKKALVDQGLDHKGGEIIKTQYRVSAEAKENGYGESEDEIIKKELINYLKHRCNSTALSGEVIECNKWIAWLEKQGETLLDNIEYVHKDAFIEKATIWLNNCFITHDEYGVISTQFDTEEEMFEDFKNYMKGD